MAFDKWSVEAESSISLLQNNLYLSTVEHYEFYASTAEVTTCILLLRNKSYLCAAELYKLYPFTEERYTFYSFTAER